MEPAPVRCYASPRICSMILTKSVADFTSEENVGSTTKALAPSVRVAAMSSLISSSAPVNIHRSLPNGRGEIDKFARTMTSTAAGSLPAACAMLFSPAVICFRPSSGTPVGCQPVASVAARLRALGEYAAR